MERIIVSRNPEIIKFIRSKIGYQVPVLPLATTKELEGKIVYGNVPMHLAKKAAKVVVIECGNGRIVSSDWTCEDMIAAEADFKEYVVCNAPGEVDGFMDVDVDCDCFGHKLSLSYDNTPPYQTLSISVFSRGYRCGLSFWEKIVGTWRLLRGEWVRQWDVVLSVEEIKRLKEYFDSIEA